MKGFTFIELIIVVCILGVLAVIATGLVKNQEPAVEQPVYEGVRGGRQYDAADNTTVSEQCIDEVVYLFVTKDGKNYMTAKQDRWGDNIRCE